MRSELIREIDLAAIGSPAELFVVPGGVGASARLLWLETMGIFKSEIFLSVTRGTGHDGVKGFLAALLRASHLPQAYVFRHLRAENRDLFSMTLSDARGAAIWQCGVRSPHAWYCNHMGESMVAIGDVDGGGKQRIVALSGGLRLGVYDLESGKKLRETTLPSDNFATVRIMRTGPLDGDRRIAVVVSDAGYPPHSYSNPLLLLDAQLNILREYDLPAGAGHTPVVFDADGDGFDELLIGYSLIDHDGSVVWTAQGFEDGADVNATRMHADHIVLVDGDKPNQWRAAVAGSNMMYLFDRRGRLIWKHEGKHPQYLFHGRFLPADPRPCLFLLNCRYSMELMDYSGDVLWRGKLRTNWPGGRPSNVRDDDAFHMAVPGSVWHHPDAEGRDIIIYNEAGWPYGSNGIGDTVVEFAFPDSARQADYAVPPKHRPDDYGYGYRSRTVDIDGDGLEEVVIFDRRFAWIYKVRP